MNRIYVVVVLSVLSSEWLWGMLPFEAGGSASDSHGRRGNEQIAKMGERKSGDDSGSGSFGSGGNLKKELAPEEIAAAVKEACKPLQAIDPNEAAKELWVRLKSLERVLTPDSAKEEAKEFLDKLEGLITNYSSPLGKQYFSAIAWEGQVERERMLILHVLDAERNPTGGLFYYYFFYDAVYAILKKDLARPASSAATPLADASVTLTAEPSSTLSSELTGSVEKKSSVIIAAAVRAASKPLSASDPNEAAQELWGRLKNLERVLTPISAKEEAKEFLDKLEGLIKNYSGPLGKQKFEAIALEGQDAQERTLFKHVDAAMYDLADGLNSPYRFFYYAVESRLKNDRDRRTSSKASSSADVLSALSAGTSSILSSQPIGSVEKQSPEIIARDVPSIVYEESLLVHDVASILSQDVQKRSTSSYQEVQERSTSRSTLLDQDLQERAKPRSTSSHEERGASYKSDIATTSAASSPAWVEDGNLL